MLHTREAAKFEPVVFFNVLCLVFFFTCRMKNIFKNWQISCILRRIFHVPNGLPPIVLAHDILRLYGLLHGGVLAMARGVCTWQCMAGTLNACVDLLFAINLCDVVNCWARLLHATTEHMFCAPIFDDP